MQTTVLLITSPRMSMPLILIKAYCLEVPTEKTGECTKTKQACPPLAGPLVICRVIRQGVQCRGKGDKMRGVPGTSLQSGSGRRQADCGLWRKIGALQSDCGRAVYRAVSANSPAPQSAPARSPSHRGDLHMSLLQITGLDTRGGGGGGGPCYHGCFKEHLRCSGLSDVQWKGRNTRYGISGCCSAPDLKLGNHVMI